MTAMLSPPAACPSRLASRLAAVLLPAAVLLTAGGAAWASPYERVPVVSDPATIQECGACHMVFQPALLPAESWRRVMSGLGDHFGEDATLPAERAAAIGAYLESHAGGVPRGVSPGAAPLRITEMPWWVRKHRPDEVSPAAFQRAGSKANCKACHRGADSGWYEDD